MKTIMIMCEESLQQLSKIEAVTPTAPGPKEVFTARQQCKLSWNLDKTNKWKSFSVDLMSGSNLDMNVVTNVFKGMDGTTGKTSHVWKCPEVDPCSAVSNLLPFPSPPPLFFDLTLRNRRDTKSVR
jgi:hypothetical protein